MTRRTTKRLLTLILTIAMLCSTVLTAHAAGISTEPMETIPAADKTTLENALADVALRKADFGLSDVDFSLISAGTAIHAYEYLSTGFEELRVIYPLFYQNEIIAAAMRTTGGHFQIVTYLADYLNDYILEDISIIYDTTDCYIYDGANFTSLYDSGEYLNYRNSIVSHAPTTSQAAVITLSKLTPTVILNHQPTNTISPAAINAGSLSIAVTFVTQQPYDNLCWAACTAMVGNKLLNTNYTAADIATIKYGETNFDKIGTIIDITNILNTRFFASYSYTFANLDESKVTTNLNANKPLIARFEYASGNGHFVCVYGINTVSHYIMVLDPLLTTSTGVTFCYPENGVYIYTSPGGSEGSHTTTVSRY